MKLSNDMKQYHHKCVRLVIQHQKISDEFMLEHIDCYAHTMFKFQNPSFELCLTALRKDRSFIQILPPFGKYEDSVSITYGLFASRAPENILMRKTTPKNALA